MRLVSHPSISLSLASLLGCALLSACIEDVAVGMRKVAVRDGGALDSGQMSSTDGETPNNDAGSPGDPDSGSGAQEDGGLVTCTPADCNPMLTVLSCPTGQSPQCVPSQGGCAFLCQEKPPEGPVCGNTRCKVDEVCQPPIGTCDPTHVNATCAPRPGACVLVTVTPLCACSGKTYQSDCELRSAGEFLSQMGECIAPAIAPCASATQCTGTAPSGPSESCSDGSKSGATCAETKTGCDWVVRKCATDNSCPQPSRESFTAGQCWDDRDCTSPKTCVGASVCPCDAKCLVADTPGKCM